jgi:shikimate dehydrogenase
MPIVSSTDRGPIRAGLLRAGLLGAPIGHSLSPRLHGYWLERYHIEGSYEAIETPPKRLAETLQALQEAGWAGVNLTLPLKEAALPLLRALTPEASAIGAVNTLVFTPAGIEGRNTDAYGFIAALRARQIALSGKRALVIGAGGAARAVCYGLLEAGAKVTLVNRTKARAQELALALGPYGAIGCDDWEHLPEIFSRTDLLAHATTAGMKGRPGLDLPWEALPPQAVVTDIVYAPLVTPLLEAAQRRGHPTIDGLGMLLHQAQPAFAAWYGVSPEVTEGLRAHLSQALA